jgi:hypothetical protein
MKEKDRTIDPLPESFETEEKAGAFWDKHSTADYIEFLEPSEDTISIQGRVIEVQIAEDVFEKLQHEAKSLQRPLPKIVDSILRKELA